MTEKLSYGGGQAWPSLCLVIWEPSSLLRICPSPPQSMGGGFLAFAPALRTDYLPLRLSPVLSSSDSRILTRPKSKYIICDLGCPDAYLSRCKTASALQGHLDANGHWHEHPPPREKPFYCGPTGAHTSESLKGESQVQTLASFAPGFHGQHKSIERPGL